MKKSSYIKKLPTTNEKSLKTLVENRTVHSLNYCELNIFETHKKADLVPLQFGDVIITSMIQGKKVMHLFDDQPFEYLPGQSVILPANTKMQIDFPEAKKGNPTQCIALAIDQHKINKILDLLNERYAVEGIYGHWKLDFSNYFFENQEELASSMNKLIKECISDSPLKDIYVEIALQELLVRIIQNQNLHSLGNIQSESKNNDIRKSRFRTIINFIKNNSARQIQLKELSDKACMSIPTLSRLFKRELGISPMEFVLQERIKKAKYLLKEEQIKLAEVSAATGFESSNYFSRIFKKYEGLTPSEYRKIITD